jgi:hypothetical protein
MLAGSLVDRHISAYAGVLGGSIRDSHIVWMCMPLMETWHCYSLASLEQATRWRSMPRHGCTADRIAAPSSCLRARTLMGMHGPNFKGIVAVSHSLCVILALDVCIGATAGRCNSCSGGW